MIIEFNENRIDVSDRILNDLKEYLIENEVETEEYPVSEDTFFDLCDESISRDFSGALPDVVLKGPEPVKLSKLDDILDDIDDTFQESLLKIIDSRGLSDTEVYKKADIDRRLFSKIRGNADYRPKKQTALALSIALGLNLDETIDFIGRAGYALSPSSRADLIVRYCIENEIYDITEVNALLYSYDQPLLGGQSA